MTVGVTCNRDSRNKLAVYEQGNMLYGFDHIFIQKPPLHLLSYVFLSTSSIYSSYNQHHRLDSFM
jgi:hypothetical protein